MAQQVPWNRSCRDPRACRIFPSLLLGPSVLQVLGHPLGLEVHAAPAFREVPLCQQHRLNQVHPGGQGVRVCQAGLGRLPSPFLQGILDLLSGPWWRSQVDRAGLETLVVQYALGVLVVPGVPWRRAHPLHLAGRCCQGDLVSHSHP